MLISSSTRPIALVLLLGALVLPRHGVAQPSDTPTQRPGLALIVVSTGEPSPAISQLRRDIQDLFLSALARFDTFRLVGREALFEDPDVPVDNDVDLLLCVARSGCLRSLQRDANIEHLVLVKVDVRDDALEISTATINYMHDGAIGFAERERLALADQAGLVELILNRAERVELVPITDPERGLCGGRYCAEGQVCEAGLCVVPLAPLPVAEPEPEGPSIWLVSGLALVGLGTVANVASLLIYLDAQADLDDFASTYDRNGDANVSVVDQRTGRATLGDVDDQLNDARIALGIGMGITAIGLSLLIVDWVMGDETSPMDGVSIAPQITPQGAGVRAGVRF